MTIRDLRRRHGFAFAYVYFVYNVTVLIDYVIRTRFGAYIATIQSHNKTSLRQYQYASDSFGYTFLFDKKSPYLGDREIFCLLI